MFENIYKTLYMPKLCTSFKACHSSNPNPNPRPNRDIIIGIHEVVSEIPARITMFVVIIIARNSGLNSHAEAYDVIMHKVY